MTCDICGVEIRIGDHPFCPHGSRKPRVDGLSSYIQDAIPGGLTLENVGPEPVTVHSYTEMEHLFASRGVQRKEKWCPTPGTSHDPAGVQDPRKYMDPVTLANGAELILRAQKQKVDEDQAFTDRLYVNRESHGVDKAEAAQRHQDIDQYERWRGRDNGR